MSSSTSYITVFLSVLPLDEEGKLPVTAPLACYVLVLVNILNEDPPFVDDPNLKPPDPLLLQSLLIQFSASLNVCFLTF